MTTSHTKGKRFFLILRREKLSPIYAGRRGESEIAEILRAGTGHALFFSLLNVIVPQIRLCSVIRKQHTKREREPVFFLNWTLAFPYIQYKSLRNCDIYLCPDGDTGAIL